MGNDRLRIKKSIIFFLTIITMSFPLLSCGAIKKEVREIQMLSQIPNGEYTLLDIREQFGVCSNGADTHKYFFVNFVLLDSSGNRYYYQYCSEDVKDKEYIKLAKFIVNDKVLYQDGQLILKEDKQAEDLKLNCM